MRTTGYTCDVCGAFRAALNGPEGWCRVSLGELAAPVEDGEDGSRSVEVCSKECAHKWLDEVWGAS